MTESNWQAQVIAAATNFADKMREATEPFREFGEMAASTMNYVNAANRARVAFPSRDDVARYAILLAKEIQS